MSGPNENPAKRPLRVLVVDDEPDTVLSTALLLEAWGYHVSTAHDGIEALQKAEQDQPDVILLDLLMPGFTGFDLAKRIREKISLKRPFMIAQTGLPDARHSQLSQESGIDITFPKPVDCNALKSLLDRFSELAIPPGAETVSEPAASKSR